MVGVETSALAIEQFQTEQDVKLQATKSSKFDGDIYEVVVTKSITHQIIGDTESLFCPYAVT